MTNEDEWNEQLHTAMNREATKRLQSRFAAGVVRPMGTETSAMVKRIDDAIWALMALRDSLTET